MLFNSFSFVFLFLPVSLLGFYAAARLGKSLARAWLALASFGFYIWWHPPFALLLLISIVFNFGCGILLLRLRGKPAQICVLALAIGANLAALIYYKYAFSMLSWLGQMGVLPHGWMSEVLLPLGISFFTFTQIGYLLDTKDGSVKDSNPVTYALFVTFFPHLIAGPILHHKEIMPQFADDSTYRFNNDNFTRGFSLFVIGMLKKVCIADGFSSIANAGFASTGSLAFFSAWGAVLCYSIQLYFDFSGYSDMAIGIARMFNVKFPLNFNSPYKSTSIIDFWSRWHMTLTRYLTMYLFNPLAMRATRKLAAQGKPINRRALAKPGPFVRTVVIPISFTMILAGVWHGAGSQFLIFGLLHASYLVINHTWRTFGPAPQPAASGKTKSLVTTAGCMLLTYLAVLTGQVFFRAPSSADAVRTLAGMVGLHGLGPLQYALRIPDWLPSIQHSSLVRFLTENGAAASSQDASSMQALSLSTVVKLVCAYAAVLLLPNSQTIVGITAPGERSKPVDPTASKGRPPLWASLDFGPRWGVGMGVMTATALLAIGAKSEFLYFQF